MEFGACRIPGEQGALGEGGTPRASGLSAQVLPLQWAPGGLPSKWGRPQSSSLLFSLVWEVSLFSGLLLLSSFEFVSDVAGTETPHVLHGSPACPGGEVNAVPWWAWHWASLRPCLPVWSRILEARAFPPLCSSNRWSSPFSALPAALARLFGWLRAQGRSSGCSHCPWDWGIPEASHLERAGEFLWNSLWWVL